MVGERGIVDDARLNLPFRLERTGNRSRSISVCDPLSHSLAHQEYHESSLSSTSKGYQLKAVHFLKVLRMSARFSSVLGFSSFGRVALHETQR